MTSKLRFEPIGVTDTDLESYENLFKACFPKAVHLHKEYLAWLYRDNPEGVVEGMNAILEDGRVGGHYACLPVSLSLGGENRKGLLAILSATHPECQGQGLFPRLAHATYEHIARKEYACVYGVGNALSTPPLVKKVDFQLVAPLQASMGFSRLKVDWDSVYNQSQFRRRWAQDTLAWRSRSPVNPMHITTDASGNTYCEAAAMGSFIKAISPIDISSLDPLPCSRSTPSLKLYIGLMPNIVQGLSRYLPIPDFAKPSPLNLVYRALSTDLVRLNPGKICFGFQDFDAY
jgi:hypothetical protein